jgi:ketosteroid isomerase-like protein
MSQENVELVRAGFAAFERGDASHLLDLMADDLVVYRADPDDPTFHGKEGSFEATADWAEGFSDRSIVPEDFIDAGDFVVARVQQSARLELSGISVRTNACSHTRRQ